MLTVCISKLKISLCFSFLFLIAVNAMYYDRITILCLWFCILHELSHLAAMRIFGVQISEISFYGGGIRICADGVDMLPISQRLVVYFAGCAVNIALSVVFGLINDTLFCAVNAAIAAFNLLPIDYFDGGKILSAVFPSGVRALSVISRITSISFIAFTVIAAVWSGTSICASKVIVLSFIILSDLLE